MKAVLAFAVLTSAFISALCVKASYNPYAKLLDKKTSPDMPDQMGCCPTIDGSSSWVEVTGCEVRVIVTVKVAPGMEMPKRMLQNCTAEDHRFRWTVDWGDGEKDIGNQWSIGGFGVNHGYHQCSKPTTYAVTANYCSNPDDTVKHQCCDALYRVVTVPAAS